MLTNDVDRVMEFISPLLEDESFGVPQAALGYVDEHNIIQSAVTYTQFTQMSVTASIATVAPFSREFIWAIFDYPFNQLGVFKIFAIVAETNTKSNILVERMGFIEETRLKDMYTDGDAIVYSMTREQCKWLEV